MYLVEGSCCSSFHSIGLEEGFFGMRVRLPSPPANVEAVESFDTIFNYDEVLCIDISSADKFAS
jgi:hypothetical protein